MAQAANSARLALASKYQSRPAVLFYVPRYDLQRAVLQWPLERARLSHGSVIHACHVSGVVRITGIALRWMLPISALAFIVRNAESAQAPR